MNHETPWSVISIKTVIHFSETPHLNNIQALGSLKIELLSYHLLLWCLLQEDKTTGGIGMELWNFLEEAQQSETLLLPDVSTLNLKHKTQTLFSWRSRPMFYYLMCFTVWRHDNKFHKWLLESFRNKSTGDCSWQDFCSSLPCRPRPHCSPTNKEFGPMSPVYCQTHTACLLSCLRVLCENVPKA